MNKDFLNKLISDAIVEDVGDGDHSSLSCVPVEAIGKAKLLVKEDCLIAGVEVASVIFNFVDPQLNISTFIKDGEKVKVGDIVFEVEGSSRSILKAERLVLNCMQRMSGIASYTNEIVKIIEGTPTKLLDTRKTTPNFRVLEKEAVKIGGGYNHRFGLYDMIMLKDNHIDYAGGIPQAIKNTQEYLNATGKSLKIEVEVRDFKELEEALETGGIDRIMLDNFTPSQLSEALTLINERFETEASGGITKDTIRAYAETGVEYISVGALTHQVNSVDLSLKAF